MGVPSKDVEPAVAPALCGDFGRGPHALEAAHPWAAGFDDDGALAFSASQRGPAVRVRGVVDLSETRHFEVVSGQIEVPQRWIPRPAYVSPSPAESLGDPRERFPTASGRD